MKLYVVSVRTKLVAVSSIAAFIMIAVVSSADLTGISLNEFKNHFQSDELKVQDITSEQWVAVVNPEAVDLNAVSDEKPNMSTEKEVLYTLVAAAVIGVEYDINDHNNDDPSSDGNKKIGF